MDGSDDQAPLTNLIARYPGKGSGSVLLAAHWDTRPTADHDPDPANRSKPIPGANDGASGVAVLLELGRVFKANPPPVTVWLVFLDGEDYGPGVDRCSSAPTTSPRTSHRARPARECCWT